jgi:phage-related protein
LQAAENAQDTADGKRRVFVKEPTPPYDKGDLWVTAIDNDGDGENDMYVANTTKLEGEKFSKDDWQPATSTFEHIKSLQEEIDAARAELDEFSNDGILTAVEKKSVRTIFSDISTNHTND